MFNIEDYRDYISPDTAALMCADLIEAYVDTRGRGPLKEMYSYWAILVDHGGIEEAIQLVKNKMEELGKNEDCFYELGRWIGKDL